MQTAQPEVQTVRPEVLLLDAGNTVVFFDEDAAAQLLSQEGVDVQPVRLRDAQGPAKRRYEALLRQGAGHDAGWPLFMRVLLTEAGVEEGRADALVRVLRTEHDRFNLWRRVPPEVPGALERLRASGVRLGMISNSEGAIEALLERVGLRGWFEVVLDSGLEGVSKPDPEIFLRAVDRMGVSPHQAVYVGDVPAVDVEGARGAGLGAILIDAYDHYPEYGDAPRIRSLAELAEKWTG